MSQEFDIRSKLGDVVRLLKERAGDWSSHAQLMEGEGLAGISDSSLPGYFTHSMERGLADLRSSSYAGFFARNSANHATMLEEVLSIEGDISPSEFESNDRRKALLGGVGLVATAEVEKFREWLGLPEEG